MRLARTRRPTWVLLGVALVACGGGTSGPGSPSAPAPSVPTVGAGGGTVSGAAARLVVPPGALAGPVPLAIGSAATVPLDAYAAVGGSVEVGPAGTAFATPATLALGFATAQPPLGIDVAELRLHVLEGGSWRLLAGGAVDIVAREVSAPVAGSGTFGVRWVPGPSAACAGSGTREFDFWLGDWDLLVPQGVAGTNRIARRGCVIEEEFHEASGTVGRSVSFLGSADGRWYQTYLDSRGNRLPLRGGLEERAMVLYHPLGGSRSTWQPVTPDRVRFTQEQQSGAAWRVTFDSTYVRR
jgi:hypothetical protein